MFLVPHVCPCGTRNTMCIVSNTGDVPEYEVEEDIEIVVLYTVPEHHGAPCKRFASNVRKCPSYMRYMPSSIVVPTTLCLLHTQAVQSVPHCGSVATLTRTYACIALISCLSQQHALRGVFTTSHLVVACVQSVALSSITEAEAPGAITHRWTLRAALAVGPRRRSSSATSPTM